MVSCDTEGATHSTIGLSQRFIQKVKGQKAGRSAGTETVVMVGSRRRVGKPGHRQKANDQKRKASWSAGDEGRTRLRRQWRRQWVRADRWMRGHKNDHRDCPSDQPVESWRGPLCCAPPQLPSAHHSIEQNTGDHRLLKHNLEFPADVKRSQSYQEVQCWPQCLTWCLLVLHTVASWWGSCKSVRPGTGSTCMLFMFSLSWSRVGWIVLKALENFRNISGTWLLPVELGWYPHERCRVCCFHKHQDSCIGEAVD